MSDSDDSLDYLGGSIHDLGHAPSFPSSRFADDFAPQTSMMMSRQQPSARTRVWSAELLGSSIRDMMHGSTSETSFSNNSPLPSLNRGLSSRQRLWSADNAVRPTTTTAESYSPPSSSSPDLMRRHSEASTSSPIHHHHHREDWQKSGLMSDTQRGMLHIPELDDSAVDQDEDVFEYQDSDDEVDKEAQHHRIEGTKDSRSYSEASGISFDAEDVSHQDQMMDVDQQGESSFSEKRWCCALANRFPTGSQVSQTIVKYAPCFCCIPLRQHTDRAILGRLNVIVAFFALLPLGVAVFLVVALLAENLLPRQPEWTVSSNGYTTRQAGGGEIILTATLWNMNGPTFLEGLACTVIFIATVLTWRVVRDVDLLGAIRYFWTIYWCIPFVRYFSCSVSVFVVVLLTHMSPLHSIPSVQQLVFAVVQLFDYFGVTSIWVRHWWPSPQMAWFRLHSCVPSDTYNTLCTVPITANETAWCLDWYNATNCTEIRDKAQAFTIRSLNILFYFLAAWGFITLLLLKVTMDTLARIISRPLLKSSRQANIPGWLFLPSFACLALGAAFTFSDQSTLNTRGTSSSIEWIGPLYVATGVLFVIAAFNGWYITTTNIMSTADKHKKLLAAYCFTITLFITAITLLTLFVTCIFFSASLAELPISGEARGEIACLLDKTGGCTNCDQPVGKCPEWSDEEVTDVVRSQIKTSATAAAIFIVYSISAGRFGMEMKTRISTYQIAFV